MASKKYACPFRSPFVARYNKYKTSKWQEASFVLHITSLVSMWPAGQLFRSCVTIASVQRSMHANVGYVRISIWLGADDIDRDRIESTAAPPDIDHTCTQVLVDLRRARGSIIIYMYKLQLMFPWLLDGPPWQLSLPALDWLFWVREDFEIQLVLLFAAPRGKACKAR